jgi:hypothetical protein
MAIQTLEQVKTALLITTAADDALLGQLQPVADELIGTITGRSFTGGTFTEYHPSGGQLLFLRNFPVTTVAAVKVDPDAIFADATRLPMSAYRLLPDRGVLMAIDSFGGDRVPNGVQVVYTTENAVPAAVTRAYTELVAHWYRQAKTSQQLGGLNVVSRNENNVETRYLPPVRGVPASVLELLAAYRVPPI